MRKKKTKAKVTPAGAVEIKEEDLDQAAGGATFTERTTAKAKSTSTIPTESLEISHVGLSDG